MSELERIHEKIDKISDRLNNIDKTLAAQHEQLRIHIEGVRLAREQNNLLRLDVDSRLEKISDEIKPIQAHVNRVDGGLKLLGLISLILGIIAAISKLV